MINLIAKQLYLETSFWCSPSGLNNHLVHCQFSVLPTNWWRCHGRPSIFKYSTNLYASIWTHCYNYSTAPFGNNLLITFILSLNVRISIDHNIFHHINNLHQNIKFTMTEESNAELVFLDTLLKRDDGEVSVLVYRKPTHSD